MGGDTWPHVSMIGLPIVASNGSRRQSGGQPSATGI
jgi:hypothetical protein